APPSPSPSLRSVIMPSRALVLAALAALPLVSGCGAANMGRVKGQVTCHGKPVREAMVTFNPMPRFEGDKEPGKPATGFSDQQGAYELSTYSPYDGALIGPHRVTVVLDDTNPARCPRTVELILEVVPGDNKLDIELNR